MIQTKLPYVFETAFPEKENKIAPITLWGVPIDPSHPVGDARVSVILVKFLRARCGSGFPPIFRSAVRVLIR